MRIQARDMGAATKLSVEFGLALGPRPLTAPVDSDALINATPLGMAGADCLNCDLALLPAEGLVFDMVSVPAETELVAAARRRGLSGSLLAGAVDLARRGGAGVVEGYPVDLAGQPGPAAGLYPGPLPVFLRAGFTEVRRTPQGRPVVRLTL